MLTFILLVVIGGGAGLWVVSMAESPKPATDGSGSSRGAVRVLLSRIAPDPVLSDDDGPQAAPVADTDHEPGVLDDDPEIEIDPQRAAEYETIPGYVPVTVPAADDPDDVEPAPGDIRRSRRQERVEPGRKVSKAYTAIEGRYADVAHVPLWRRVLSLLGILAILGVLGVGIAAVLGAAFAAVAEVFNNTIG